jgi:hypothetical protein
MNLTLSPIHSTAVHGHAGVCSKMPGGEGIAMFLLLCYVGAALVIFAIALGSAALRARKSGANVRGIWAVHTCLALLVTVGPVAYAYTSGELARRAARRQYEQDNAWERRIVFDSDNVTAMLNHAVADMPPRGMPDWKLEGKALAALSDPHTSWTARDLDAFSGLHDSIERAGRVTRERGDNVLGVIATWHRDRATSMQRSRGATGRPISIRSSAWATLRTVVQAWCQSRVHDELAKQASFRDAAVAIRVPARRRPLTRKSA